MYYFIFSLLGIFIGSISNALSNLESRDYPLYKWYLKFFYSNKKFIVVNIIMAVVFNILFIYFGITFSLYLYLMLCSILCIAGVFDFKNRLIPNQLIIIGISVGFVSTLLYLNVNHIIDSVLGSIVVILILGFISFISRGGIGVGDIKLFACVGIFLGLQATIVAIIISILISGAVSLILLVFRILNRNSTIPFAPFIFLGVLFTALIQ